MPFAASARRHQHQIQNDRVAEYRETGLFSQYVVFDIKIMFLFSSKCEFGGFYQIECYYFIYLLVCEMLTANFWELNVPGKPTFYNNRFTAMYCARRDCGCWCVSGWWNVMLDVVADTSALVFRTYHTHTDRHTHIQCQLLSFSSTTAPFATVMPVGIRALKSASLPSDKDTHTQHTLSVGTNTHRLDTHTCVSVAGRVPSYCICECEPNNAARTALASPSGE